MTDDFLKTINISLSDMIVVKNGSALHSMLMTRFPEGIQLPPIVTVNNIEDIQGVVNAEIRRLTQYMEKLANDPGLDAEGLVLVAKDALRGKPFEE